MGKGEEGAGDMSDVEKYRGGFSFCEGHPITTVEWLLSEKSNENELIFLAYDANLCGLPPFHTWKDRKWKKKHIEKALSVTRAFCGKVYLDDTPIK